VRLQIVQQWNLLFQFIDRLPVHELFTSTGRMERIALHSQARMVGGRKMFASKSPKRRRSNAHRRTVEGSGSLSGSLVFGTDSSQLLASRSDSQACWRQWRL
jgi:hypothetical protein